MTPPQFRPRSQQATPVVPESETFLGDELISIPTTANGTALAAVPANARHAYIVNLDAANRVILRLNGTVSGAAVGGSPDATHGVPLAAGVAFDLTTDPTQVKLLAVGAAVNVYVMYFGD